MQAYWVTFSDGSHGSTNGQSDYDAKCIAEHIHGPTVTMVERLPYLASPVIWQFNHPVNGVCPPFCFQPNVCRGKTDCPNRRSCAD